jgi:hypothetical protein
LPLRNETERCVRTDEVIDHLVDALLLAFELTVLRRAGRPSHVAWPQLRVERMAAWRPQHHGAQVHAPRPCQDATSERPVLYRLALRLAAQFGRDRFAA